MSLLIWLPLTKDLQTYGVQHSEVTATGATHNANGKLGGCYYFNTTPDYLLGTQNFISNKIEDFTFSCWAMFTVSGGTRTLFSCRTNVDSLGITIFASCGGVWYIDDGVRWQITPTTSININTWYHICIIRKKGVGKYLYINGELDSSTTTTGTPTGVNTVNYAIGACHQNTTTIRENQFYGYLNDVRFYDHTLSVAEIKDISKGLCLHYKLDDFYDAGNRIVDNTLTTTEVVDSSGYGNHGTKTGNISVSYNSPRYEISTVFDGSTCYIDIVSDIFPPVLNGDFTISVWIYNNDAGDRSIFLGNWNLTGAFFGFEKTVAEKVRFYWNGSPDITFGNSIVTANAFSLVTVTRSGNTVKCYINGILKDTSTSTLNGSVPATATNFRIASDGRTGATRFKGQMSDFRIYATALSAEDVLALYNVGARVFKNGMMAGYELKEGE